MTGPSNLLHGIMRVRPMSLLSARACGSSVRSDSAR